MIYASSPLYHHAERIKAALILLQGSEDNVVPPDKAQRMLDAVKRHGGDVKAVLLFFEG